MDLSTLTEQLRVDYKLDVTVYPDSYIESMVNNAIKKISEYYPEQERTFLLTVADQTRYTVVHASLMKVMNVYYLQGYSTGSEIFGDPEIPERIISLTNTYNPSQTYEQIQSLEVFKKLRPSGAEIVSFNKFDLIPTPTVSNERVYYDYARYRLLSEVPDIFEEDVLSLFFYYTGEAESQRTIADTKNNKYMFERRGNVTVEKDVQEMLLKRRKMQMDDIVKNIKSKVMKL